MLVKADYIDVNKHTIDKVYYDKFFIVIALLLDLPDYFGYIEKPLVIMRNGKTIYIDEEYKDLDDMKIQKKYLEAEKTSGKKLVFLGYDKEDIEMFTEKYFTVIL